MKPVWKWVIGIIIALVVIAALVGGAFLLRARFASLAQAGRLTQPGQALPGPFNGMRPFGGMGWGRRGMFGSGMMGFGRAPLIGGIFGGLIMLGVLALIVLAIIWLVRGLRKPKTVVVPASSAVVPPVMPAVELHPCPKCGEPVQAGWKHCPNCGESL